MAKKKPKTSPTFVSTGYLNPRYNARLIGTKPATQI